MSAAAERHGAWNMRGFRKLVDIAGPESPELKALKDELAKRGIEYRVQTLWALHPSRGQAGVQWGSRVWVNQRYLFIARSIAGQFGIAVRKAATS